MKILVFMTQFYQLNGAERLGVQLATGLNERGIHADVMSMYSDDLAGVTAARDRLLDHGVPNVFFLGMRVHPSLATMPPAISRLRHLLDRHLYDVIETSMISPSVLASWATVRGRTRHVSGLHHIFNRDDHNSARHKFWKFSCRCNSKNRYYGISDRATQSWIDFSGTPPQHTRTVYNAIGDEFFDSISDREGVCREIGIPDGARLVLYVGRLASLKGVDTILNALSPVFEEENMYLLIAGAPDLSVNGTEDMLGRMDCQIQSDSKMSQRVKQLGFRKDISRLMASCDLLVHPPRTEGFGLVLAEAMAAGLQVVATNVGGIPEVIQGTDTLTVPPNDHAALRDAVLKTLHRRDSEKMQAIKKGRDRANSFRMSSRLDAMINLFNEVLDGRF